METRKYHRGVEHQEHPQQEAAREPSAQWSALTGSRHLQFVCMMIARGPVARHFLHVVPRAARRSTPPNTQPLQSLLRWCPANPDWGRGTCRDILTAMTPVALITGASRGIGRGIALALARAGWNLAVNYAGNAEAAAETVRDCVEAAATRKQAIRVIPCRADVTSAQDRTALVDRVETELGPIDLLVNNAGIAPSVRADLLEATEASFDTLIATNLKGPFLLTQHVARRMLVTPPASEERSGIPVRRKIVFVSSISAYTASVQRGDYCISKAGVSMLTKLFAARLAGAGIGVFEIRPGIIATDMTRPVQDKYDRLIGDGLTPIRRWGTPEDVGKAVLAIADDLLPFSTGEVLNVDGGFHLRTL